MVEGARLESVCRGNSTEGSNPSLTVNVNFIKTQCGKEDDLESLFKSLAGGALIASCSFGAIRVGWPPAMAAAVIDQDEDGVPDAWEEAGIEVTLASGAKRQLDLKGMGASSRHKDLFVWVAWMEGGGHSHKPLAATLKIVQDAFARAPIQNLDGTSGIRLHILFSDTSTTHVNTLGTATATHDYDWGAFQPIKDARLPKELNGVFHFALFAHMLGGFGTTSGISRGIGAYDFIVSLGAFPPNGVGTTQDQAGTFMHELGHNLNLRHGGADDANWKPNFLSVMNYAFQFDGLIVDGVPGNFDYSRFRIDLDEQKLDRFAGMTSDQSLAKYGSHMICGCQLPTVFIESIAKSTDWDCSERPFTAGDVVSADVNGTCSTERLTGADDWSEVQLVQPQGGGISSSLSANLREMDLGMARKISIPPVAAVNVNAVGSNAAVVRWTPIPLDRVLAYRVFRQAGQSAPVRVASTDRDMFIDTGIDPGVEYRYSVSALVADRGAAKPIYLDPDRVDEFRRFVSPTRGARWGLAGMTLPLAGATAGQPAAWTAPKVLYQTPPSNIATLRAGR